MKSLLVISSTFAILICAILLIAMFTSLNNLTDKPIIKPSLNAPNPEASDRTEIDLEDYLPKAPKISSPFLKYEHSNEGEPVYTPPANLPSSVNK